MSVGAVESGLFDEDSGVLQLPEAVALQVGSNALAIASPGSLEDLGILLGELRNENCGHSWRTLLVGMEPTDPQALAQAVLSHVERGRPTTLFTYSTRNSEGRSVPVAVATVSLAVSADFPYAGFPVLARCFIREPFRGMGLYPLLVRHRLELCRAYFGDTLQAVHIGAGREPVLSTLERGIGIEPDFLYVGEELLSVAGEDYRVRDFIAPMPAFRAALLDVDEPLFSAMSALLDEGGRPGLVKRIREIVETGQVELTEPVRQFVALLDAIGVIE